LLFFLNNAKKRRREKRKTFSITRTLLHGESFVLLSSRSPFARSISERKGKDIDVIGFPQLLEN